MAIKQEIQSFIAAYAVDMDKNEKDLIQEIFDQFAGDPKKQDRILDLLHGFVAMGYDDGVSDSRDSDDAFMAEHINDNIVLTD